MIHSRRVIKKLNVLSDVDEKLECDGENYEQSQPESDLESRATPLTVFRFSMIPRESRAEDENQSKEVLPRNNSLNLIAPQVRPLIVPSSRKFHDDFGW